MWSSSFQNHLKSGGSDEIWDRSEAALKIAVETAGLDCKLNPGEGAFYGPKLEFVLRDAIGRDWQCGYDSGRSQFARASWCDIRGLGRRTKGAGDDSRALFGSVKDFVEY